MDVMVAEDAVPATEAHELTGGSVDPDIRTDIETDDRFYPPADGTDGEQSGTTGELADTTQTATSDVNHEVLNSETARQFKTQFRRRTDSDIVNVAAVEDDYVLMFDSKSTGEWMIRVPKTRQAVMPDERFWTIPENWEKRLTVDSPYRPEEILYSIPESGVFVVVEPLAQKLSRKAGYRVKSVGDLDITCRPPNHDRLETALGKHGVDVEVTNEIDQLIERWSEFEVKYLMQLIEDGRQYVMSAVTIRETPTVDSWYFDPWAGEREQKLSEIISSVCDVDDDISKLLAGFLAETGIAMQSAELTVDEDTRLPPGYRVQAAVERGCAPGDAVDELTERFDATTPMSSSASREADDPRTRQIFRSAIQQVAVRESR
jgi:hypothetical protein